MGSGPTLTCGINERAQFSVARWFAEKRQMMHGLNSGAEWGNIDAAHFDPLILLIRLTDLIFEASHQPNSQNCHGTKSRSPGHIH
jgi:hypothetical protein